METSLTVKGSWLSEDTVPPAVRSLFESIVATCVQTFYGRRIAISFDDNHGLRAPIQGEEGD